MLQPCHNGQHGLILFFHTRRQKTGYPGSKGLACKWPCPKKSTVMKTQESINRTEWLLELITWTVLTLVLFYV